MTRLGGLAQWELQFCESVEQYRLESNCDLYVYNGWLQDEHTIPFIQEIVAAEHRTEEATLVLATYGGDAHSAYRLARAFQRFYSSLRLLVVGPCKSAGTLVAVGANEIAFGPFGELGPLDVQLVKPDDLVYRSSGLDTLQGLAIAGANTYANFRDWMFAVIEDSRGAISTTTASEIASKLATGLMTPIAAQIDPQRLGEVQRIMDVAKFYGARLGKPNLKPKALDLLVEDYPSHQCIIDEMEAESRLFETVSQITELESSLLSMMPDGGANPLPEGGILTVNAADFVRRLRMEEHANAESAETEHAGDREDTRSTAARAGGGAAGKANGGDDDKVDGPIPSSDPPEERPVQ